MHINIFVFLWNPVTFCKFYLGGNCFYLFTGITIIASDCWKPEKKSGVDKLSYHEKAVEMNKVLSSAHETSRFFRCYDYRMTLHLWHSFFTHWRAKFYKICEPAACMQFYEKSNSLINKVKRFSRICFFKRKKCSGKKLN